MNKETLDKIEKVKIEKHKIFIGTLLTASISTIIVIIFWLFFKINDSVLFLIVLAITVTYFATKYYKLTKKEFYTTINTNQYIDWYLSIPFEKKVEIYENYNLINTKTEEK